MALLVGKPIDRDTQGRAQNPRLGLPRQKTGHIGAFYCPGTGADTDGVKFAGPKIGKQPVGQFRQAFYMRKERVALPQAQAALGNLQQARTVMPLPAVKHGDGGGIVTGIKGQNGHSSFSFKLRAKEPRMPLTKATTSSSSYFRVSSTHSLMATPVGTSSK